MKKIGSKHSGLTLLTRSRQAYPDSPDKARLEAFENAYPKRDYWVHFDCPEFTCLCPITAQPDFGHITIRYIPNKLCLESKSLKLYLFSFRNHGTFHEEVVNRILDDVVKAIKPRQVQVKGVFNPRGGIGITVEAVYPEIRGQRSEVSRR
jgi:7-cyano-7-deazaguanine reductase